MWPQVQQLQQERQAAAQQQQSAQLQGQQRRVREDENTVIVRGTRYTKLECVGRGGSSKVFKVHMMNSPSPAAWVEDGGHRCTERGCCGGRQLQGIVWLMEGG